MNNWRASHSFPLNNFQINLRRKVKTIQQDIIVAQRIKRLESIIKKLRREQTFTLKLSQMQDIGGCRAVLTSIANVKKLEESYRKSTFNHILRDFKDYIARPKADGYRGSHLIYQYQSMPGQISSYDKLRIEIQIRTSLQHTWATTVESVDAFTKQALKSNRGSKQWLRFFALMGSACAIIEDCETVPDTPTDRYDLIEEIRALEKNLFALQTLHAYTTTVKWLGPQRAKEKYFLLDLKPAKKRLSITRFSANQSQLANQRYTNLEKQIDANAGEQAVLVSIDSIAALKRAYPNYFLDTRKFTSLLRILLDSGFDDISKRIDFIFRPD